MDGKRILTLVKVEGMIYVMSQDNVSSVVIINYIKYVWEEGVSK